MVAIAGLLALFLILALVSTFALTLHGFTFFESVFETASALGTVGLSSGVTSSELALSAKLILILDMWAGRLEILPVVLFFYLSGVTLSRRLDKS